MFVPAIEAVPSVFEVFGPDPEYSVLVPLAISDDQVRRVAVETLLIPFIKDDVLFHELQFAIAVTSDEADEAFVTCERDMAVGYIPKEVRHLVMPSVCGAIEALIETVQPVHIYRVTKATRPPEKALAKHEMITNVLVRLGYEVQQKGTDRIGRLFWVLGC